MGARAWKKSRLASCARICLSCPKHPRSMYAISGLHAKIGSSVLGYFRRVRHSTTAAHLLNASTKWRPLRLHHQPAPLSSSYHKCQLYQSCRCHHHHHDDSGIAIMSLPTQHQQQGTSIPSSAVASVLHQSVRLGVRKKMSTPESRAPPWEI